MALDADRIRKTSRKLRKLIKKAPRRPNPDQVHTLRTSIRRMEAASEALNPNPQRRDRRLLRDLARIRKRAGKVRDMDVLTADAASLRVAQEQDCAVELLQHVGAKRYKQADRLHSELRKEGKDLSRRIKKFSARLEKRIPDSSDDAKKNQLPGPTDVAAAALRLSRELTMPRSLNRNNLHPYRLKVKQLRDVLRLAENTSNPQFTGVLGEVKDAIGDWHDWEELVSIAARVLTHGANCKLLAKLKEVSGEKYDHAFSLTIKMRKRFLRAQNHKLPGPVLVATAGIAS
jgi:CHAD domain-containing protein